MTLEQRIVELAQAIGLDIKQLQSQPLGNVFIQESEPNPGYPFIWFKTDENGKVIDILKG